MSTNRKIVAVGITLCLCFVVIVFIVSGFSFAHLGSLIESAFNKEANQYDMYQYNVEHAVMLSEEIEINPDDYISFSDYKFTDGQKYIVANYYNVLPEKDSDVPLRVNKYFIDEAFLFTDGDNRYFYTDDEKKLYYYREIKSDNSADLFIKKDYVFPTVEKDKVVSLLIYDSIVTPEFGDYICSDDFSKVTKITDTAVIEKTINEYKSGSGDFNWLDKHFNYPKDTDYLILAEFEDSTVYQTLGRKKVDISDIKAELKNNAWIDLCRVRYEDEWNIDNCMFITCEDCYKVIFFNNEDTSSYGVELDKTTLKLKLSS